MLILITSALQMRMDKVSFFVLNLNRWNLPFAKASDRNLGSHLWDKKCRVLNLIFRTRQNADNALISDLR